MKIRLKATIYLFFTITFLNSIFMLFIIDYVKEDNRNNLNVKIEITNKLISLISAELIWGFYIDEVKSNLSSYFADDDIWSISIEDMVGNEIVNLQKEKIDDKFKIKKVFFITRADKQLAKAEIIYSSEIIDVSISNTINVFILFTIILLTIILLGIYLILKFTFAPMGNILKSLGIIKSGNFDHKIDFKSNDEFQKLTDSINSMTSNLKKITASKRELEEVIKEKEKAQDDVKTLSKLLPVCASCKKIRDDKGYWQQVDEYISTNTSTEITHTICKECAKELYGNEKWFDEKKF